MSISFDKAFGHQATALSLRAERHQVLSENLANADTPNYKARDFDFQSALKVATQQAAGGSQLGVTRTDSRHIPAGNGSAATGRPDMLYRVPFNPALDGNTVETQAEQARFAENTVQYQAALNFLGGRITSLIGAIRGE